jgi:hypothetical protein
MFGKRAFHTISLLALAWPMARAQDSLAKEADQLTTTCSGGFGAIPKCAGFLFSSGEPLHFTIPQSVVPGGGTAFGLTYTRPVDLTDWAGSDITVDGEISARRFWFADTTLTLSHRKWFGHWSGTGDRFQIQVYGHARGLPLMPFYGIGPDTARSGLADFEERDYRAGVSVNSPLAPWLNSSASIEYLKPQVGGVGGASVVSIDSLYSEATAPGLIRQPGFVHYNISLQPGYRLTWTRFHSDIAYHYYQDAGSGKYSFGRFHADFLQTVYPESQREPTNGGNGQFRRQPKFDSVLYIAGRFSASSAAGGRAEPFYLQETLGGSDIDNVPTLRGFQDYRFRGPDLVSLQVQYERRLLPSPPAGSARPATLRSVAGALGILAFYDAGEVATRVSNLSPGDFRQSFGFGMTFWSGEKVWFRAYLGLGSGEGRHTFFGVNNPAVSNDHL